MLLYFSALWSSDSVSVRSCHSKPLCPAVTSQHSSQHTRYSSLPISSSNHFHHEFVRRFGHTQLPPHAYPTLSLQSSSPSIPFSTIPIHRLPPRHAQSLKDLPLILPLHLHPLCDLDTVLSPDHITIQPALIQPHPLFTRQ